ncbi:MAG: AAA family ATPase [bacterium]|nr:AAA family ATPase [bacterium]
MKTIANYIILEKIDETRSSMLYRGRKKDAAETVIIKVLKNTYPSDSDIARFRHEYDILRTINIDGIVKAHDIIEFIDGIAIILEDFGGRSLKSYISEKQLSLSAFLEIGIKVADILGELHKQEIIHYDIKPANILINEELDMLKLADFGITKILSHEDEDIYNPAVVEGTLVYMSPEQTGRMNRAVDYRTDLYSLGITFYEVLTGSVPFQSSDPMEIIHSHIARAPRTLQRVSPGIPGVVSDIVMKLLAKNADERYQNSLGLKWDLNKALDLLEEGGAQKGTIEAFEPGSHDVPLKFQLPQIFVGREEEKAKLQQAFERVSAPLSSSVEKRGELVLVSGPPGIGKSFLINEMLKSISGIPGYFVSGKYEQVGQEVPYSALIEALKGLIGIILTESQERIDLWRERLLAVLGPNGKIIIELIPNLEFIIGEQPEVPVLPPEETENRFLVTTVNFIKALVSEESPVILFLDDLQWADRASLKLIQSVLSDPELEFFLGIGAYRDTEVDESHPLVALLQYVAESGIRITACSLDPLDHSNINEVVSQLVRSSEDRSIPLANLLHKKTGGNPFFVSQFLKRLYEVGLLELDSSSGWKWDMEKINQLQVTDNVVQLMSKKISSLEEETQAILKTCACLGNRFNLEIVSLVTDKPVEEVIPGLRNAVKENLFIGLDNWFSFSHDRIREAAYSLIPESEKGAMHYRIGKLMLTNRDKDTFFNNILYIVNQLNYGIIPGFPPEEKEELARLNLEAGIRAKAATANESALTYLKTGISLLEQDCWQRSYDLALSLYEEAAEAAYLNTDYAEMERLSDFILQYAKDLLHTVNVYEMKINVAIAENRLEDAVSIGLDILSPLGVNLPRKPGTLHVVKELALAWMALLRVRKHNLVNLPEMTNKRLLAAMRILWTIVSPTYRSVPEQFLMVILRILRTSVKYGNSSFSPFIYGGYGLLLCRIGKIDQGYYFGQIALELTEKMERNEHKARTYFIVNSFLVHWKKHIGDIYEQFLDIYREALEHGDMEYAARSLHAYCYQSFFLGNNLEMISREFPRYIALINTMKQDAQIGLVKLYHQLALNLSGQAKNPRLLRGESFNEETMIPLLEQAGDRTALCTVNIMRAKLLYLFRDFEEALECVKRAREDVESVMGSYGTPLFYYYDSLVRVAACTVVTNRERRQLLKLLKGNQKKMKQWAEHGAINFAHKHSLVEAEIARVKGNNLRAMKLYEKAITEAHKSEYIHEEAMACECAGRFYLDINFIETGSAYITRAYNCYSRWGAGAKMKDLEEEYFQYVRHNKSLSLPSRNNTKYDSTNDTLQDTTSVTLSKASDMLDLSTVISASQTLSREIDLGRLLKKMMKFAIENAGAEKGFLILENPKDGKLYIEASGKGKEIRVLQSIPVRQSKELPLSIVNYVARTGENVILNDARVHGLFCNDPYIVNSSARSILCAQSKDRGEMASIVYLENNLVTKAFTTERIQLLSVLSAQCAISMSNARLISREKQNAALEREVEMARAIQQSLLPKEIPEIENAVVAFKYEPMMGVGGDFINICLSPDSKKLGFFICDVSGHGIPAALTASMISMSLDFFQQKFIDRPAVLFKEMRNPLKGKMGQLFFTACSCCLDLEQGLLVLATAGHPPVIIVRKNGPVEMAGSDGSFINDYFEPNSEDVKVQLQKGDRVILYTDGISEARNPEGEFLGVNNEDEFSAWIKNMSDMSPSPSLLCRNIYNGVVNFTGGKSLEDDFTILVVEYQGE